MALSGWSSGAAGRPGIALPLTLPLLLLLLLLLLLTPDAGSVELHRVAAAPAIYTLSNFATKEEYARHPPHWLAAYCQLLAPLLCLCC